MLLLLFSSIEMCSSSDIQRAMNLLVSSGRLPHKLELNLFNNALVGCFVGCYQKERKTLMLNAPSWLTPF